jgi:uncharacterized protein (DUF1800 family)
MISSQVRNQHLMWRAGFGPAAGQLAQLGSASHLDLYQQLHKSAAKSPTALDATNETLKALAQSLREEAIRKKQLDADQRRQLQQQTRQAIRDLNLLWLDEMVQSDAQLREKMSFFWHGHFASRNLNVFFQQQLLQIIRQNALGSFRDLLHQVSKSASILNFLNANQNRKDHPNENFAREVMELFTLGRGNYTEQDVKEAARAFTGWGANREGEFAFRRFQHDAGSKVVLAKNGSFTGEQVLDILLEQKQTARYITRKLYSFFVNEAVDNNRLEWLSDRFYKSDYSIGKLMEDIFTSDWFYDEKNIGAKIKSPVELIVGLRRILPMKLENDDAQLLLQRVLGQVLFYPPNVAGWPGGKSWIDSSTLMMRMRLPQLISDKDEMNVKPKADDDQMMGKADDKELAAGRKIMGKAGKLIKADIDWTPLIGNLANTSKENLLDGLNSTLLQVKPSFNASMIRAYTDNSSREGFIKTATVQIMSTPEYQMC